MDKPWIDVSVPLASGMVHWPGDPEPSFQRLSDIDHGAEANITMCRMTAHTGTHMDAPCHFLAGRQGIDSFPLSVGIGEARVINIENVAVITKAELAGKTIRPGERILLRTDNSRQRWDNQEFHPRFVGLDASAAQYLADVGVSLIGVDYLSVGLFEADGVQTHRILLSGGVWIVEGLQLANVEEGVYELICLPLKIEGSDGAPARVVLRQLSTDLR